MKKILLILPRWLPALLIMIIIFLFSSRPGGDGFGTPTKDYVLKKTAHVVVYAALAWSYFYLLNQNSKYYWLAWALAILYAATDEYHQSFVPGRTATVFDVIIFDNLGSLLGLWLNYKFWKKHE
ncbi:MAG: VanZ family protein [Anaerolineales bacterium]